MIKVIDEPCGRGKTSWAIQQINQNTDKSYIFCTPFLNEIDRIKKDCSRPISDPRNYGKTKLDSFNDLLMNGESIAVTHCTFSNSDDKTIEYLKNGNYTLILDEVLDVLVHYNTACNDCIRREDIDFLLSTNTISIDPYDRIIWTGKPYTKGKFASMYKIAKRGHLYYLDRTLLMWQFPPEIFSLFDEVYVLTYLFKGSLLKPYFEYHGLKYEMVGISLKDGIYTITEYHSDKSNREKYKKLIKICDNPKLNDYKASSLCKDWFDKRNKNKQEDINKLKFNVKNYLKNITGAKSKQIMWTCYDDYKNQIKGKGYSIIRRITEDEKKRLNNKELDELKKKLSCFVTCNARATNNFQDRSVLAYAVNMYSNPFVKRYFKNKNDDKINVTVDEDYYALSCLIQWVFRSRIRNGQPIEIYIPSSRMRSLFMAWLDGRM